MNEAVEHGFVLYQSITDPDTDEVTRYTWSCLQCESGSGASPSLEEAHRAGDTHSRTGHGHMSADTEALKPRYLGTRFNIWLEGNIDNHPLMWTVISAAVVVAILALLLDIFLTGA